MTDGHDTQADDALDAQALLANHMASGEPLGLDDVRRIVAAGLADEGEFDMTGGGCYLHAPTFPDPDAGDAQHRLLERAEAIVRTLTHEGLVALTETCLAALGVDVTALADLLPDADPDGG